MKCLFTKTSRKHCLQVHTPSMITLLRAFNILKLLCILGKATPIKHEMCKLHWKWPNLTLDVAGVLSWLLSLIIKNCYLILSFGGNC